jgi:16S rRNA (cytidine1402-2'-O)-methyltransferase
MPTLHLIPTPLAPESTHTILPYLHPIIKSLKVWCVEDLRTARRFLKSIDKAIDIDSLTFYVVNEHEKNDIEKVRVHFLKGEDVGLLSDAGCPAVADPGSDLVWAAQTMGVKIMPHIGPNSILLALMASGFNGQAFTFNGYLPVKNPERGKALQAIEQKSINQNCTQIFIETPYRNNQMLEDIIKNCDNETRLCIAVDINAPTQQILSTTIGNWKHKKIDFNKRPAVFLIMGK